MKLSRTVVYAAQAMIQLASSDSQAPVPCSRMAADGKMPERFLLQILRRLVNHGVLTSTRGVDGGYSLARKADQITLLEIIEAIEGPLSSALPSGEGISASALTRLRGVCDRLSETVRRELATVRLSELEGEGKKGSRRGGRRGAG